MPSSAMSDAVGPHVGDEANGIAADVDAFVKTLRGLHRAQTEKPGVKRAEPHEIANTDDWKFSLDKKVSRSAAFVLREDPSIESLFTRCRRFLKLSPVARTSKRSLLTRPSAW